MCGDVRFSGTPPPLDLLETFTRSCFPVFCKLRLRLVFGLRLVLGLVLRLSLVLDLGMLLL